MRPTALKSTEFITGLPFTMAGSPLTISLVMSLSLSGPMIWHIVPTAPSTSAMMMTGR